MKNNHASDISASGSEPTQSIDGNCAGSNENKNDASKTALRKIARKQYINKK
jgi:hypothetical protein